MDPDLIFFAIRSLIRIGTAGRDAYEQSVRDQDFAMPPLPVPVSDPESRMYGYFNQNHGGTYPAMTAQPNGPLAKYWRMPLDAAVDSDEARAALMDAADQIRGVEARKRRVDTSEWRWLRWSDEESIAMLPQWAKGAGPIDPWARIGLALADVVLDYLNTAPKTVGLDGNAENLVKALTGNLRRLLPDPNQVDSAYFVERLAVALLQAGLKTLADTPSLATDSGTLQALVGNMATPLVTFFDAADPAEQLTWGIVRDKIFPLMVQAGLTTLAQQQKTILGSEFDPQGLTGALTQAFLQGLVKSGMRDLGTQTAWIPIYQSLLQVIATRPNLIKKSGADDFFNKLIADISAQLAKAPTPFSDDLAANVANVVLSALANDLPMLADDQWGGVVTDVMGQVVNGIRNGSGIRSVLGRQQLIDMARVVLDTASRTPGMITCDGVSLEIQAIVGALAGAMAADSKLLISTDGWKTIVATATAEAARNPGRLFKIADATPEAQLATKLISTLMSKVSLTVSTGRGTGGVLFGDTLVEAVVETLKVAAGNATKALVNEKQLGVLVESLNTLAQSPDQAIGAQEWLWLFRQLVANVLDGSNVSLTPADLKAMLYKGGKR